MAKASGLALIGVESNDPIAASTTGTGELVFNAVELGARRIVVGVGGSATTDGGFGAIRAMYPIQRLRGIEVIVACDVRTAFLDAPRVFGPQKGASAAQVELLERRLKRLAQVYLEEYGVDVTTMARAGAAGGLGGGLAAVGARLVDGFDFVAEEVDLYGAIESVDLVITGEGFLDEQSFDGKVVGGVASYAADVGVPVAAIAGRVFDGVGDRISTYSLVDLCGETRAVQDTMSCISEVATLVLNDFEG
jgi:glycerate kinase